MSRFRLLGAAAIGVVGALALGALVMLARLTPTSDSLLASVGVLALLVVVVAGGVVFASRHRPDDTPYW